jgi:hypothetical protein
MACTTWCIVQALLWMVIFVDSGCEERLEPIRSMASVANPALFAAAA